MKTEKLLLSDGLYEVSISRAAEILKSGGIVGIPTETVYGLAASAYDENAIKKVFSAKGRPQDNPLIVHISNYDMLYEVAQNIPKEALLCAETFWPGPFTMILPRTEKTAPCVSAGLATVAVRMPSNKAAHDIIEKSGLPLAAPSANLSGSPSPTTAEHVVDDLDEKIDAVVFGDECEVGVESTVVSFCSTPPRLLRPGAVTAEQLSRIIPDIIIDKAVFSEPQKGERVESPGMKYKHYSPKTDAYLVTGDSKDFTNFVNSKQNCAAICFSEDKPSLNVPSIVYGTMENELTLAHDVFSALREIDGFNVDTVYIHSPSKTGVGLAVYNRLVRAAAFKVIELKTVIGLTGPTGAGKSTVSSVAEKFGYYIIDCDKSARMAVKKGSAGLNAVVKVFGNGILNTDGTLNRQALAKIAFSSKDNVELLNITLLPYIVDIIKSEAEGKAKVLLDAPTLFESGINSICKKTVAVLAEREARLARIVERDGITEEAAVLRMNAGKPDEFYIENADFVIYNNDDLSAVETEFENIIKSI